MKTRSRHPSPRRLFFTGFAACIGIYAVFYLKSYLVVHKFLVQNGGLGFALSGLALLVVACLSGVWAILCESVSYKAAFLTGLSFPGLLFGASLGFGDSGSSKTTGANSSRSAIQAGFDPMFAVISMSESGVVGAAFKLVFNPAGVLLADKQDQINEVNRTLQAKEAEFRQVKQTLEGREQEIALIRRTIGEKQQEVEGVNRQLKEKVEELLRVNKQLMTHEEEIQKTSQRVEERAAELARVKSTLAEKEREISEVKQKLANTQRELERSVQDLERASGAAGVAFAVIEKQAETTIPGSRSNLTARIIATVGDVQVRQKEGAPWQKGQVGQSLTAGSDVRTQENGYAVLSMKGQSVTMSSNTQLRIALDETKAVPSSIELKSGKIFGNVRKVGNMNHIEVRTPIGVAAIRG